MSKELDLPGPDMPVIDESRLMAEFGGDREILAELRDGAWVCLSWGEEKLL